MKRFICWLTMILLLIPTMVLGAGSSTQSFLKAQSIEGGTGAIYVVKISWLSDASAGTVPATATGQLISAQIRGLCLMMAVTVPGAGGTQPTSYTITLTDSMGVAPFKALLASRHITNVEVESPVPTTTGSGIGVFPILGPMTYSVAGAGNSKTGDIYLYFAKCPYAF